MVKTSFKACLLAMTAFLPVTAYAQNAPQPAADDAASTGDIIVTARKREETLQSVPIAITAFNADEIKAARIERLSDVAKLTPGLNYAPLFGRQNQLPIIRGAAQTFGQLNVGVFLDGVYLSGKGGVDLELNDLERIEVVKGPQSALYGRNTFAGAINYVTARPTRDFSGRIEGTIGTDNLYKVAASVSGPIGDKVGFRVGGYYKSFDGWYRSAFDGGRVDFEKSYGGIGTLELRPSDAFTATFRLSYSKNDDGQPASSVIRNNSALGTPAGGSATQQRNLIYVGQVPVIPQNGVTVNTGTFPGLPGTTFGDREETTRASATFEYDFGNAIGTSITSYSYRKAEYTYDGDNTFCDRTGGCPNFGFPFAPAIPVGASQFALSSNDGYLRDWSQELRFASSGSNKIDWLIGFFYYHNVNAGFDRGLSPTATSGATAYTAFNPNYSFPKQRLTTDSYSAFGSATWHVTDQLSITGELRYEYEEQSFTQCPTYYANPAPVAGLPLGVTGCATASPILSTTFPFTGSQTIFPSPQGTAPATAFIGTDQSFNFVTPRIIVNYKIDAEKLIYATFAQGAKTGGFNTGLNVFVDQRTYQPEYSDNYEIGLKTDWMDRKLRLNLAGYYVNWRDQQAACQNPITAGGSSTNRTYVCNVAASHIYGLEAELVIRPADYFTLSASYTYTHARYTKFVDATLNGTPGTLGALALAGLPNVDFDGKSLPYVPDHKLVVSPRFNIPLGGVKLEARADIQYQSRTFVRADNFASFGAKTVVDLRIGADFGNFRVQAFANNVFNDRTPTAAVRFFDSVNYSVSSPLVTGANLRQIGVTVGAKF